MGALSSSSPERRRTSSSPRATMYASDHAVARGDRDHLEGADEVAKGILGHGAEERQRGRQQDLRAGGLVVVALGGVDDLRRLRGERRARQKRAQWLEALEVRQRRRRRFGLGEPVGPHAEGARHRVEVAAHVDPERAQIADGGHRERQVRAVDGAANGELEALDRGLRPSHLLEESAGDDQGARRRGSTLHGRGGPAHGGLGLVREEQRKSAIDGGVGRLGARQIRRGNTHGAPYPITARPVLSFLLRSVP
jgi:hypothetical protein